LSLNRDEVVNEALLSLAIPHSTSTVMAISDLYDKDHRHLMKVIHTNIKDLIDANIDFPDSLQRDLKRYFQHSFYVVKFSSHGKDFRLTEKNAAKYIQHCININKIPHLIVQFPFQITGAKSA